MRHCMLLVLFALVPFTAFTHQANLVVNEQLLHKPNTVVKTKSNETNHMQDIQGRTIEFPTQIIRMKVNVEQLNLTCDEVTSRIDEQLLNHIVDDLFLYNTLTFCQYTDSQTEKAIAFEINSYFDPISDKAVEYTKHFIAEQNGSELLGGTVQIESATGLIVALNVTAGTKKNPDSPPFIVYRQDHNDFYFKSNYDMRVKLITDIYDNFFSNEPATVLPFYDRWFDGRGASFYPVLKESNVVELFPDRIFVMNQGADMFVSNLNYYFALDCNRFSNRRCLM